MDKFNGMSQIEIEMVLDQMRKAIPVLVAATPIFADLVITHLKEYKSRDLGISDKELIQLAVASAAKQSGLD